MAEITLLTNTEWAEMVRNYQETGTDEAFADIYEALNPLAVKLGHMWFQRNRSLSLPAEDFVNLAQFAIFKAVQSYDGTGGSKFVSYYKTMVKWTIQDELLKKKNTKSERFNMDSLSLDYSTGTEGTFADAVENQYAVSEEEVYGEVIDPQSSGGALVSMLLDAVSDFELTASVDDGTIIRTLINTVLTVADCNAKVVNSALADVFPDVKAPTLRKKKQRALERFTAFAKENGLEQLDLSQF